MCLRAFDLVTVLQTRSNGLVDEGKHGHASRNLSTPLQGDGIVPLGSDSAPDGGQETEQPFHWTIFQRKLLGIKTPLNTVYRCLHPAWKWCSFYLVILWIDHDWSMSMTHYDASESKHEFMRVMVLTRSKFHVVGTTSCWSSLLYFLKKCSTPTRCYFVTKLVPPESFPRMLIPRDMELWNWKDPKVESKDRRNQKISKIQLRIRPWIEETSQWFPLKACCGSLAGRSKSRYSMIYQMHVCKLLQWLGFHHSFPCQPKLDQHARGHVHSVASIESSEATSVRDFVASAKRMKRNT